MTSQKRRTPAPVGGTGAQNCKRLGGLQPSEVTAIIGPFQGLTRDQLLFKAREFEAAAMRNARAALEAGGSLAMTFAARSGFYAVRATACGRMAAGMAR